MAGGVVHSGKQRHQFATTAGNGADLILLREVDIIGSTQVQLIVRVHSTTTVSNTALTVKVRSVAPAADDPGVDFVITASELASQAIANNLPAGTLYLVALNLDFAGGQLGNLGSHVRVALVATAIAAGAVDVTISVDLVMKS